MSRQAQPPKLKLRPARGDREATWVIYHKRKEYSTGCCGSDTAGAQAALEAYLAKERVSTGLPTNAPAHAVDVVDVLTLYFTEKSNSVARSDELRGRVDRLVHWWDKKTLADITEATCVAYAKHRGSPAAARRELEDMRAAVTMAMRRGICRDTIKFTLPEKPRGRVRYLTRDEVARLLWAAWRTKEVQRGSDTAKYTTRHVARFILAALYTGSRSHRVHQASYQKEPGHPWFDLEGGVFYRAYDGENVPLNKRAPPIRIPSRLLAHMKRWRRNGAKYVVEYNGKPSDPKKAFAATVKRANLDGDVVRHTFRHTSVTWLMQAGADTYEVAGFAGMSKEVLEQVYGHHHPDHQKGVSDAFSSGRAGRPRPTIARQ